MKLWRNGVTAHIREIILVEIMEEWSHCPYKGDNTG